MMAHSSEWVDPMLQVESILPEPEEWEDLEPFVHDSVAPDLEFNLLYDDDSSHPGGPASTNVLTAAEASQLLGDFMIDKWCHGKLAAIDLCMMCFWMKAIGATGIIQELAKMPKPNERGKCKDHIRKIGLGPRN